LSCHRAPELLHGYVDGELDRLQTAEVERHIEQCEDCKLDYRSQINLRSSLDDPSLYYHAPANLKQRIRLSLQKEAKAKPAQPTFPWGWTIAGVSLALLLLIGAVWNVVPLFIQPSNEELLAREIVANHIRSLQMTNHLTDVLSSDQHTVKPWFSGKVDYSPPIRDFAEQDFRLYGGRLEYLNSRTVAALIYQRRLHYINLYISPTEQVQTTGEVLSQRQGYNVIHWSSSGLNFWAISDLSTVELLDFARLVQQAQ
jgi:anti-sigma factor RsiW